MKKDLFHTDNKRWEIGVLDGKKEDIFAFLKTQILNIAFHYCADEFKIILLLNEDAGKELYTARWLPHIWDNGKQICFAIFDKDGMKDITNYLKQEDKKEDRPFFLVIGFDNILADTLYQSCLKNNRNTGLFLLADENVCRKKADFILHAENNSLNRMEDVNLEFLQLANQDLANEKEYLVEVYLPAIGRSFDVHIPRDKKIGEITERMEEKFVKQNIGYYKSFEGAVLCEREEGAVLHKELTPDEMGILTGTRLMLI